MIPIMEVDMELHAVLTVHAVSHARLYRVRKYCSCQYRCHYFACLNDSQYKLLVHDGNLWTHAC
jgi:hypothetical protein